MPDKEQSEKRNEHSAHRRGAHLRKRRKERRKTLYPIDWSRKNKRPRGSSRGNEQICEQDTLQFRISGG